jgi:hypothetical protein
MSDPEEFLKLEYRDFRTGLRGWKGFGFGVIAMLVVAALGARYLGLF